MLMMMHRTEREKNDAHQSSISIADHGRQSGLHVTNWATVEARRQRLAHGNDIGACWAILLEHGTYYDDTNLGDFSHVVGVCSANKICQPDRGKLCRGMDVGRDGVAVKA